MELTLKGIQDKTAWEAAGIALPSYDVEAVAAAARKNPMWVHFGIGNIFRIFLGGICDRLLNEGLTDRGITCAETFDYDLVDMIYDPYDNLGLSVILNGDGTREIRVLGSMAEAVRADASRPESWARLKEIFEDPGLQMVSFTITEKGYALRGTDGEYFPFVEKDLENGPEKPSGGHGGGRGDAGCPFPCRRGAPRAGLHGQLFPERQPLKERRAGDGRRMAEARLPQRGVLILDGRRVEGRLPLDHDRQDHAPSGGADRG